MTLLRINLLRWISALAWLLEYEPTWIPEFGFAFGAIGWGLACFATDDLTIEGSAWILPVLAIVLGVVRGFVLLRLWYATRVALCGMSMLLWSWLWWGFAGHYGIVPMMGVLAGVLLIELLTAAKFSVPCAREIVSDIAAWRNAR